MRYISIDAETNGLMGRAFAVAITLNEGAQELDLAVFRCPIGELAVDPWVTENVMPALVDLPENCADYPQMLAKATAWYRTWVTAGEGTLTIAHVAWPVEARLLLDMFAGDPFGGPYPLIDVSSVLLANGFDPTSVDGYLDRWGLLKPEGSPHHPLYDCRAAARCFWSLMHHVQKR